MTVGMTFSFKSRCGPSLPRRCRAVGGFTMIELIVVIGIIILAAGTMSPTIVDFFKGRKLRIIQQEFRSAINSARLRAVNERSQVRLVFFREGIRVFADRENKFVDENFSVEGPFRVPAEGDRVESWYVLGFQNGMLNNEIPSYTTWKESGSGGKKKRRRRIRRRKSQENRLTADLGPINLDGLPQIAFLRDGSVSFLTGVDVASSTFNRKEPTNADLILYARGNTSVCLIDIQPTGQNKTKIITLSDEPMKPGDGQLVAGSGSKKKEKRKRRRSRQRKSRS